ncbi:hypothetical protein D3C76_25490 [compost metagenome]
MNAKLAALSVLLVGGGYAAYRVHRVMKERKQLADCQEKVQSLIKDVPGYNKPSR